MSVIISPTYVFLGTHSILSFLLNPAIVPLQNLSALSGPRNANWNQKKKMVANKKTISENTVIHANKLNMAELITPTQSIHLAWQSPAGVKSPFGEILSIFMVSKMRAASAMAVLNQTAPLQTFHPNHLPRRKIW